MFPVLYEIYNLHYTRNLLTPSGKQRILILVAHWFELILDEKQFLKVALAFFASSDGVIIENLESRLVVETIFLSQW